MSNSPHGSFPFSTFTSSTTNNNPAAASSSTLPSKKSSLKPSPRNNNDGDDNNYYESFTSATSKNVSFRNSIQYFETSTTMHEQPTYEGDAEATLGDLLDQTEEDPFDQSTIYFGDGTREINKEDLPFASEESYTYEDDVDEEEGYFFPPQEFSHDEGMFDSEDESMNFEELLRQNIQEQDERRLERDGLMKDDDSDYDKTDKSQKGWWAVGVAGLGAVVGGGALLACLCNKTPAVDEGDAAAGTFPSSTSGGGGAAGGGGEQAGNASSTSNVVIVPPPSNS